MDAVLEEIKTLREDVKARVGEGLQGLSAAAERISAEVISELGAFHTQVCAMCSKLFDLCLQLLAAYFLQFFRS
jgi:kinesin family protein 11